MSLMPALSKFNRCLNLSQQLVKTALEKPVFLSDHRYSELSLYFFNFLKKPEHGQYCWMKGSEMDPLAKVGVNIYSERLIFITNHFLISFEAIAL